MTYKILKILKKSKDFVSGEFIANELGITRAGIWKHISKLRRLGYKITSINNKGYLLEDLKNLYNEFEILENLQTEILGKKCIFFDEIDSTNLLANKLANDDYEEGTIVVANFQYAGKGRLEKKWFSEKDTGIYFSLILKPKIELIKSNQITLIAGLALCNVFKKLDVKVKIKWPNDIILNNKKIAGILTEVSAEIERVNYIILGIGINVNNKNLNNDIKNKATSIFLETGKEFDRTIILQNFLYNFELMYFEYLNSLNFTIFLEEYKKNCISLNKEVKLLYKNKEIYGKVIDITENGELIFLNNDKEKKIIVSGEVSIRNIDGTYI